jgi:hypothetical protein
MEMKAFADSMFVPLILQKDSFLEKSTVAYNWQGITNSNQWIEDDTGVCFLPNLIKIELTFDGNIMSEDFDELKAEIFSIVATTPKSFIGDDGPSMSEDQNTNMLKNIMNCFGGQMIELPEELNIVEYLLNDRWSYRVILARSIYPCVVNGCLFYECL